MVDAHHHIKDIADFHRRRHDHAFGATVKMALQRLRGEKFTGALQYQFYPQVAPGNVSWRSMRAK